MLYQWYFNNGTTNTLLGSTDLPTYFVHDIANGNEGTYSVVVASGNCTTQPSNATAIDVTTSLDGTPTLTTTSTQLCMGGTLTLNSSVWPNAKATATCGISTTAMGRYCLAFPMPQLGLWAT